MNIRYLATTFGLAVALAGGSVAYSALTEKDRFKADPDARPSCPAIPGEHTQLTRRTLQKLMREGYTPVAGGVTTPIPAEGETPLMMMIAAPLFWMVKENGEYILLQGSPDGTELCYRTNGKGWSQADALLHPLSEEERMRVPSFKESQHMREQAPKQTLCGDRGQVLKQMQMIHDETPVFQGVNKDGVLDVVTYNDRTGKFTYLISLRMSGHQKPPLCTRAFGDRFNLG